jgi:hypothetical protein
MRCQGANKPKWTAMLTYLAAYVIALLLFALDITLLTTMGAALSLDAGRRSAPLCGSARGASTCCSAGHRGLWRGACLEGTSPPPFFTVACQPPAYATYDLTNHATLRNWTSAHRHRHDLRSRGGGRDFGAHLYVP